MQPFRFVHASRVQLDSPVIIPGECASDARQLAEDATIQAFRTLVDECVSRDADLLLLTGDTFGASLVTLREQMELEQGLQRLSDHDVAVVIVPGPEDPAAAWREHMRLPTGVFVIDERSVDPIVIERNGQDVGAVFPVAIIDAAGRPHGCKLPQVDNRLYRIGLVGSGGVNPEYLQEFGSKSAAGVIHLQLDSCDADTAEQAVFDAVNQGAVNYLAIGVEGARMSRVAGSATLHNPGPLQSLDASIVGPCGASLVSIDHEGRSHIERLPCARIRWEQLSIEASGAESIKDLAIEMEQTLKTLTAEEYEELWIVRWELNATTKLLGELRRTSLNALWDLIDGGSASRPSCHHILQVIEFNSSVGTHGHHVHDIEDHDEHLRADLELLIQRVSHEEWSKTAWGRRIVREVGKLSPSHLVPRVRESVASALHQAGDS